MIAAAIMLWINYDIIVCSTMPIARSHSIESTGYEVVSTIVSSYCLLPHNDGDIALSFQPGCFNRNEGQAIR